MLSNPWLVVGVDFAASYWNTIIHAKNLYTVCIVYTNSLMFMADS